VKAERNRASLLAKISEAHPILFKYTLFFNSLEPALFRKVPKIAAFCKKLHQKLLSFFWQG